MSVKLEKELVSDRTKLILEYLHYSESSNCKLIESDFPSKKLQYPIKRVSFQISYDLALIDKMGGFEFEKYVAKLFEKFDFDVVVTKKSRDFGCDVIIEKNGYRIAIQTKRSESKASLKAVQEIVASLKKYDARLGVVISNQKFTKSARQLAKINGVVLINGNALLRLIDLAKMDKTKRNFNRCQKQIRILDSKLNLSGTKMLI